MQINPHSVMLSQDGGTHSGGGAAGVGLVAASQDFYQGFHGPMCAPWGRDLVAAEHSPEAGHRGGTLGLGAILWSTGHAGWDSGTQSGPMVCRSRDGSWVSRDFA